MKKKLLISLLVAFLLALIVFVYLTNEYVFVLGYDYSGKIGIIDANINYTYDNLVIYESEYEDSEYTETHGDELLSFLNSIGYSGTIYYYEAVNENGNVQTENIIAGLNWMKENGVQRVNISLSSKYKNDELENWIEENSDITVYCCYNNKLNSFADYPSMYSGVVASGSDKNIEYKDIDVHYNSNKVVVLSESGLELFEGNSFLSLYTMLKEENSK